MLREAITIEYGKLFESCRPVTFAYVRNTVPAPRPTHGDRYQQKIEPAGRYLIHNPNPGDLPRGWERGSVHFDRPLVIWFNLQPGEHYNETSWKAQLYAHFRKRGRALSQAIVDSGYDGIVTVMPITDDTREIVDLRWLAPKRQRACQVPSSLRRSRP